MRARSFKSRLSVSALAILALALADTQLAHSADDPQSSPLFDQSLRQSIDRLDPTAAPLPDSQLPEATDVADTTISCIYELVCVEGDPDSVAELGLVIGMHRKRNSCSSRFNCAQFTQSMIGSLCLSWRFIRCESTDLPPIPGVWMRDYYDACACGGGTTRDASPTCLVPTCIMSTCIGGMTCTGSYVSCAGAPTCDGPTCDPPTTCDPLPTCGQHTTCSANTTCSATCPVYSSCAGHTACDATCTGETCGENTCAPAASCPVGPTCYGSYTCGHVTCERSTTCTTCHLIPTCEPTCFSPTCPDYTTCGTTCDGQTCEGSTCSPQFTCDVWISTCVGVSCDGATCDPSFVTCIGPTCLATCGGGLTCNGETCILYSTCPDHSTCGTTCVTSTCSGFVTCGNTCVTPTCEQYSTCGYLPNCLLCNCPSQGDLNRDGRLNLIDLLGFLNILMDRPVTYRADATCPAIDRADLNCDDEHTMIDVIIMVDYVFRRVDDRCNPCIQ